MNININVIGYSSADQISSTIKLNLLVLLRNIGAIKPTYKFFLPNDKSFITIFTMEQP